VAPIEQGRAGVNTLAITVASPRRRAAPNPPTAADGTQTMSRLVPVQLERWAGTACGKGAGGPDPRRKREPGRRLGFS